MSISEFWQLTFSEFVHIWYEVLSIRKLDMEYKRAEFDLLNEIRRDIYEQMRFQTSYILTALSGKEINPFELFPLVGDKKIESKKEPVPKERFDKMKKAWT